MQGYDLDNTLAGVDFTEASRRPLAALFADAPVLFTPTAEFLVISGRPHAGPERRATSAWLRQHQPFFKGIRYVTSGDATTTAQRKVAIINSERLTDYTDNNPDVLAAMGGLTRARLWLFNGVRRSPYVDRAALADTWAPTLTALKNWPPR